MSRRWIAVLALAGAAALGSAAAADPVDLTKSSGPNTYFNSAGATLATHDLNVLQCLALAAREGQPNPSGAPGYSLLGMEMGAKTVTARLANTENCMVARGWRVVAIPPDEADALAKLERAALAARLSDWVGAETPHGVIVRQWANDLADAATIKFKTGPMSGRPNLSLSAIDPAMIDAALKAGVTERPPAQATPLTPEQIASAPRDSAVIVFRITGPSLHNGDSIVLEREPGAGDAGIAFLGYDNPFWEKGGKWFAFEAPPGDWRIRSINGGRTIFEVRLCLGSPSFAVAPGEVVYAGTFDLASSAMRPDLSLEPAKAWLAKSGDAAQRLKPALYFNRSKGACGGSWMYRYDIPGQPDVQRILGPEDQRVRPLNVAP